MNFVTVTDLACRPTEAMLSFEQHGFGVSVLRVQCDPALDESVCFPPCTADPDLLDLAPGGHEVTVRLVEASGEEIELTWRFTITED